MIHPRSFTNDSESSSPGPFENLHREARSVSPSSVIFEGGRLDLGKVFSENLQILHSFVLGAGKNPSSYNFMSIYASKRHLIQGTIDHQGDVQGKYYYGFSEHAIAKAIVQHSRQTLQSIVQLEGDVLGKNYTLNGKLVNFNPMARTGVATIGLFQRVLHSLSLGAEGIYQSHGKNMDGVGVNLVAKHVGKRHVFTGSLQNFVGLQLSYYHRISEKMEFATEFQSFIMGSVMDTWASVSCKVDYKQSCCRIQGDSTGKMSVVLEEQLLGRGLLVLCGEMDHVRGTNKFGIGLNIEN